MNSDNLLTSAEALKLRERWKYVALEAALQGRVYEFEYQLGEYVFDLALLDARVLVEFDGPYHAYGNQPRVDAAKEQAAEEAGFIVVRRVVQPTTVISPATVRGL
jgi:very-short-patch-repair endonuclease